MRSRTISFFLVRTVASTLTTFTSEEKVGIVLGLSDGAAAEQGSCGQEKLTP